MPPNLSAAIARMPSDVPFRIRTPYNQLVTMIESFIRREQVTREGEEWNIAGSPGGGGGADLAAFFPRYLPGAVAYVTAANQFMAPQTIYFSTEASQSFVGLTLQATVELVGDASAIALQVLGTGGASAFSVAGGGNVAAAGNADFAGTLAVGTADAFTVAATGAFIALSGVCEVRTGANATVGLRVRQNSSSQSGNLFELTSSAGTVLAAFDGDANTLIMPSSFAIGASTNISTFTSATAVGGTATVSANGGSAFGNGAFAGNNAVAVGINAACTAASGVAIGVNAAVSKSNAVAIGNTATAAFAQAAVFGGGTALATNEMVYGNIDSLGALAHFRLTGHSSVQARSLAEWRTAWISSTDASRTVRATFHVNDFNAATTGREYLRADSNGTGATVYIGFDSTFQGLVINESGASSDTRIEGDTDTDLFFVDASADFVGISTNAPGSTLDVAGSFQCDSVTNDTGLAHGTFTPTRSAEANLDANVTMTQAQYMRVGNTVTMSGRFTADPTTTATATSFEFTLPVASNIGAAEDLAGVAFCGAIAGQGAAITGSVANNTAVVSWVAVDTTSQTWSYTLTYEVI